MNGLDFFGNIRKSFFLILLNLILVGKVKFLGRVMELEYI